MPDKMKRTMVLLVEAVVVGLVLLVALAAARYLLFDEWFKTEQAMRGIKALEHAVEKYHGAHGCYPNALEDLIFPRDNSPCLLSAAALVDPWGQSYRYEYYPAGTSGTGRHVIIWSEGPPGKGITITDEEWWK
jgi:hypothetical protein